MPRYTWDTQADWDAQYIKNAEPQTGRKSVNLMANAAIGATIITVRSTIHFGVGDSRILGIGGPNAETVTFAEIISANSYRLETGLVNDHARGEALGRPGVKLHYHKGLRGVRIQERAAAVGFHLGPAQFNKRICIVGGAFGWTAEEMLSQGFLGPICVAETSAYILAEKDNDDEVEIRGHISVTGLDPDSAEGQEIIGRTKTAGPRRGTIEIIDADISTSAGRGAVRSSLGGWPGIVITEAVMESLDDAEAIAMHAACDSFPGNPAIVHMVYTSETDGQLDPVFNWKTLAEWLALIPSAIWVDLRNYNADWT